MTEEELISEILKMREAGFNASKRETLPFLFKEKYGFELKRCSDCENKAWERLIRFATKEKNKPFISMAYRIKEKYKHKNFRFIHKGKPLYVNAENLTDERAELMLRSEYAHAIEGQPDKVEEVVEEKKTEVSSQPSTVLTSTSQESVGKPRVKSRRGKLYKPQG